jgi:hypothetical protein
LKRLDDEELEGTNITSDLRVGGSNPSGRATKLAARKVFASSVAEMFPALFGLFFSDIAGLVSAGRIIFFEQESQRNSKIDPQKSLPPVSRFFSSSSI